MRPNSKVLFLAFWVFLFSSVPGLAGESSSNLDLEGFKERRSFIDDFLVNDDSGTAQQWDPDVGIDGSSNFIIAWYDDRNGNFDIYAQRYSSSGTPLDSNFRVNDDVGTAKQWFLAIAMNDSCNFVITWEDYRNANCDIYAQRFNSSGNPLSSNFKVNDDAGTHLQYSPDVSIDNLGNFVITWEDYRNANCDIYAQRYSSSGTPLSSNFKVNTDAGTAYQYDPEIAMEGSGNFVITWDDERNGNLDIYSQRYNSSGTPLGSNFKVNTDAGTTEKWHPTIAMDGSGNFVIAWDDYHPDVYSDIYAQRYNASGTPLGSNFKVNDSIANCYDQTPPIAMDNSGNFIICWNDQSNDTFYIYAQRYYSSGNRKGENYLVPNFQYFSIYPTVAANTSNIYFAWMDFRRGNFDIYAKVVDWNWSKVEEDEEINVPNLFALSQNYPNPFNPETQIEYALPKASQVKLTIYNLLGQKVTTLVDEFQTVGFKTVHWDGKDDQGTEVASGVYFYKLKAGDFSETKKMILLK
jgi:hypothetical protein